MKRVMALLLDIAMLASSCTTAQTSNKNEDETDDRPRFHHYGRFGM